MQLREMVNFIVSPSAFPASSSILFPDRLKCVRVEFLSKASAINFMSNDFD